MAGQRQKNPDDLAFKRGGRYKPLGVVEVEQRDPAFIKVPNPPPDASKAALEWWATLWASPLSGAIKATDVAVLYRYVEYFDTWQKGVEDLREEGLLIAGANGGLVRNPVSMIVRQCEAAMRDIERAFGLDPLARMRLGIKFADASKAAAGLKTSGKPRARAKK